MLCIEYRGKAGGTLACQKLSLGVVRGTQKLNSQWDKGSGHVWEGKTNFGWADRRSLLEAGPCDLVPESGDLYWMRGLGFPGRSDLGTDSTVGE